MQAEFLERLERLFLDRAVWTHRQSSAIAAPRADGISFSCERMSEVEMRHGQSGIERDGASRIGDREIVLSFQVARIGAIRQSDGVLCFQLDGPVVTLDCGIEITLLLIGGAEIAEGCGELWLDGGGVRQH